MTYEKVMERYWEIENIKTFSDGKDELLWVSLWIVTIVIIFLALKYWKWERWIVNAGSWFTILMMVIATFVHMAKVEDMKEKELQKWKENYVDKYIESLPIKKMEIDYFELIDDYGVFDVEGDFTKSLGESWTIKYLIEDEYYKVQKELRVIPEEKKGIEKPYITYQYLDKQIPGVDRGIYNAILYIPKK